MAHPKPVATLFEIKSIDEEIKEWGGSYSSEVHLLEEEAAFPELASEMEIAEGTRVFHSIIVHKSNGKPVMLGDRFVNPVFAPDYLAQDFTQTTPSKYLMSVAPVSDIEHIIEAGLPDQKTQELLKLTPHDPCLFLHRQTWGGKKVVTHCRMTYPGNIYRIGGRFKPVLKSMDTPPLLKMISRKTAV